jgi:alpha-mannosidase
MNDGQVGITLSNADCYFMRLGNSTVSELDVITPQISVLAGGRVVNGNNGLPSQGGDKHFLQRFALRSHTGYDPVASMRFALEHQNPFTTGKITGGDVYPEITYSYLYLDNPNVLLWALKPAEDGLASGIVIRVWNVSNEKSKFSISIDGGIFEALFLSHIETPIGNCTVENGRLVDEINQQQIKTYAIFPANAPSPPDTSGKETSTPTPVAVPPGTPTPSEMPTKIIPPTATPMVGAEDGKGCLLGLLQVLGLLNK